MEITAVTVAEPTMQGEAPQRQAKPSTKSSKPEQCEQPDERVGMTIRQKVTMWQRNYKTHSVDVGGGKTTEFMVDVMRHAWYKATLEMDGIVGETSAR
jgi:negative regulator of sigma E activity